MAGEDQRSGSQSWDQNFQSLRDVCATGRDMISMVLVQEKKQNVLRAVQRDGSCVQQNNANIFQHVAKLEMTDSSFFHLK